MNALNGDSRTPTYVSTPPSFPSGMPTVARTNGAGMVHIWGFIPASITARDALDLGHRLVEAAIAAKRAES